MLRAASRASLVELRSQLTGDLDALDTQALDSLAGELFAVAGLLADNPQLRRTLGDHSTDAEQRGALVDTIFGGKIGDRAVAITRQSAQLRWSTPWDFADSLELAGNDALFTAAEKSNELSDVEDELFRFQRILDDQSDLSALLDEQDIDGARRVGLLDSVIDGKVTPTTKALLDQAVRSERKRTLTLAIDDLLDDASARRERSVAKVLAAAPLTDAQQDRLAGELSSLFGRQISVRTAVDPAIRGGLIVRVGDEVIDGSVATRLANARAALAG